MRNAFLPFFLLLFIVCYPVFSDFHLVRLHFANDLDYQKIISLNLDFESAVIGKDFIEVVVNDFELGTIKISNLNFEVVVENYEKYLSEKLERENNKITLDKTLTFSFGSMGGFYKLNEIFKQFDELVKNYSYFIQADTFGYSFEGRPLIAYAFGSNEPGVPEVLITALHHSREPATVTSIVYFLNKFFELASNGDQEANYLLSNRKIWVIPILNPDGYFYNEKKYPNGGGLWRKNRRPINDKDTGVDLNRNYGPFEFWNANNNGSSTNPSNETYRGPEPFSEPESKALREFCLRKRFVLALNYHTYGGMLIYPYSALPYETPDSLWFRSFGKYIQPLTSYYFGTDLQTVGYSTRGSSDDWFYIQDSTKGKVFAFSPEASYQFDGFWPNKSRIIEIGKENYPLIWNFLWSAGANIRLIENLYSFDTLEKKGTLFLDFQNIGIRKNNNGDKIYVRSLSPDIHLDTVINLPLLEPAEVFKTMIKIPVPNASFKNGTQVDFVVTINQNGILRNDTISHLLYAYEIVDFKSSENWYFDDTKWGYEFDTTEGKVYLCDSPYGNYIDSLDNYLYSSSILLDYSNAELEIRSRWIIEPFYDFALIEVSTDFGDSWIPLRSKRSMIASQNQFGKQKKGTFGFAGYFNYWNTQIFSLSPFLRKSIKLRLSVLSDRAKNFMGWDIERLQFRFFSPVDFGNFSFINDNLSSDFVVFKCFYIDSKYLQLPIFQKLRVFNVFGKKLVELNSTEVDNYDFYAFPQGIYFFIFENEGQKKIIKAIKQ